MKLRAAFVAFVAFYLVSCNAEEHLRRLDLAAPSHPGKGKRKGTKVKSKYPKNGDAAPYAPKPAPKPTPLPAPKPSLMPAPAPQLAPMPAPMLAPTPQPKPECLDSDDNITLNALLLNDGIEEELASFPFDFYFDLFEESAVTSDLVTSDLFGDAGECATKSLPLYQLMSPFSGPEQLGIELRALNENDKEFFVKFEDIHAQFTSFNITSYALMTTVTRGNYSESNILSLVESSSLFMIRDLAFYENFIEFDADDVVFPYDISEGPLTSRPFFRPHPCDVLLDEASQNIQYCLNQSQYPRKDWVCAAKADGNFNLAMTDQKNRYLREIRDSNNAYRQQVLLEQLVYGVQMVESLTECKSLQSVYYPNEFEMFRACFSAVFRRSVDQLSSRQGDKNYPLVPLLRTTKNAEAALSKAEQAVCELYAKTVIDCVVCVDEPPYGISELKGKLCQSGAADCSPCVNDVKRQSESIDLRVSDGMFRFDRLPKLYGYRNHVQGVGRLRDWNGMGRMVVTENASPGFHIAFNKIEGPIQEGIFSTDQDANNRRVFWIRNIKELGNHAHPGGLQAHGDFVAVAMEKGDFAAVYFLKVKGSEVEFLHSLKLDGSQYEPGQPRGGGASAAGFIRLEDGRFLLAVNGATNGLQGIWFYATKGSTLDADTEWVYIGFEQPGKSSSVMTGFQCNDAECVKSTLRAGVEAVSYFGGSSLSLITECTTQDIYMITMSGSCGWRCEGQWYQIFKVTSTFDPYNFIRLEHVGANFASHNNRYRFQKSFRWGAGVAISADNRMVLMNTERWTTLGDNDWVDGGLYYSNLDDIVLI